VTALIVSEAAREQIEEVQRWWLENRQAAPNLFEDELEAAFALITHSLRIGVPYAHPRAVGVRRVMLIRCRYHLYYQIEDERGEHETVVVVALWHAQRGSGPPLR
jgi:plasmid stabilization system protein ParE